VAVSIEINPEFRQALELLESSADPLFITGKAGTGKSTLLSYFRENTQKRVAILAPTGVAAVNVRGQTIHSFFGFKPNVTVRQAKEIARKVRRDEEDAGLYNELDAVVIDEVSMVRADLLDCVDAFLRTVRKNLRTPFGGLRMVFIGDLYQLPPVVSGGERSVYAEQYPSPYFFDAQAFSQGDLLMVELERVYRQKDERFIEVLNAVRNNSLTDAHVDILNKRCKPDFEPVGGLYIHLAATNDRAAAINARYLTQLKGTGRILEGHVEGDFEKWALPTDVLLELKKQAQVMLVSNDSEGRWVNGTMAEVTGLPKENGEAVRVKLQGGGEVEIHRTQWDLFRYQFDRKKKILTTEPLGTFKQYPLRLAWAVTIHKSQGKTFDHVILDTGRGMFAPGQMYVALSRCRSLEGLVLKKPLRREHVFVDERVVRFMSGFHGCNTEPQLPIVLSLFEMGKRQ
jgi:ATP-dependent exoDNAse (exonuclease V) alpha subunit